MWGPWWLGTGARAQDSGADLLNVARRAAVVDQVLAEHDGWMRDGAVFGVDQRVRVATDLSVYTVSALELTTPDEGTFPVEMARSFTGFHAAWLSAPRPDGLRGEEQLWLSGGGLAYGLNRPYELPLPGATTGAEPPDPEGLGDLEGEQFSDEQYTLGARVRGFVATASWVRGQVVQATDDGRADLSTLTTRHDRGQIGLDTPIGVTASTRFALDGGVENVAIGVRVNDAVALGASPAGPRRAPQLSVGFRKSDYGSADRRDHPRILGAGVAQDLAWLLGDRAPDQPTVVARLRAQADLDLAAPALQLGLAEAEAGWYGRFEVAGHGGASWFHDEALTALVGRSGAAGATGGAHLGASLRSAPCTRGASDGAATGAAATGEEAGVCVPNFGLRALLKVDFRQSWAEDLRYVAEYAGKPQTFVYVELLGGV